MVNTLMGIRHLYESLMQGEMPKPNGTRKIGDNLSEIDAFPIHRKDKLPAGKARGLLYVKGTPKQLRPFDKPAGVIAVSGAGNYSSSIEIAMALFLDNKAVIHKPNGLTEASDAVRAKIYKPVIDRRARRDLFHRLDGCSPCHSERSLGAAGH